MIDLDKARGERDAIHIIAGRDKGAYWRKFYCIEDLDSSPDSVDVRVPEDIYLLSLSFFLSLFGDSVRRFGPKAFEQKYRFVGNEAIAPQIKRGIEEALKTTAGLPSVK